MRSPLGSTNSCMRKRSCGSSMESGGGMVREVAQPQATTNHTQRRRIRSFYHLAHQAGFAFEKTLGVERLLEAEMIDVEMVAELVDERAQKRLPRHHARFCRRAHPHLNARLLVVFPGVEAVQFGIASARPDFEHLDVHAARAHGSA